MMYPGFFFNQFLIDTDIMNIVMPALLLSQLILAKVALSLNH